MQLQNKKNEYGELCNSMSYLQTISLYQKLVHVEKSFLKFLVSHRDAIV